MIWVPYNLIFILNWETEGGGLQEKGNFISSNIADGASSGLNSLEAADSIDCSW